MKIHTILATLLFTPALLMAEPGHDHSHDDHGHDHGHGHEVKVEIPATLRALWQGIESQHASLSTAVEKKDAAAAHTAEETLQAYLAAVPEKTADLDDAKKQRIDGQAKNLARAYDNVHHAADEADWSKSEKEMKKAAGVMKLLASQMPKA